MSELRNAAILDNGATNTVTSKFCMNTYIDSLEEAEKVKVRCRESKNFYCFWDGSRVPAIKNVDLPIIIGNKSATLNIDVVQNDIPLLLSRKAIKTVNMTLDFKNNNEFIFDEPEKLIVTKSGHYALPINPYSKILNSVVAGTNPNITPTNMSNKSKHYIAVKLHWQFLYPSPEKLLKLLNCAGEPWNNDEELKRHIQKVSEECALCQVYRKPPPRPVVGLLLASSF